MCSHYLRLKNVGQGHYLNVMLASLFYLLDYCVVVIVWLCFLSFISADIATVLCMDCHAQPLGRRDQLDTGYNSSSHLSVVVNVWVVTP